MKFLNRISKSSIFKISVIVVLVETFFLVVVGVIYIRNYNSQVDRRIIAQMQIPGKLMQDGLLSYNSVGNSETIQDLIGEEVVDALVVGLSNSVYFSSDIDNLGKNISEIPDVDDSFFNIDNPQDNVIFDGSQVVSITPIYETDTESLRLFLYIKAGTGEAEAEKREMFQLFIFGSTITLVLTSLIIIYSFNTTFMTRIDKLLNVMEEAEAGNLTARYQETISEDEIGRLQIGVNSMLVQLEKLVRHLESLVVERTKDLEFSNENLNAFAYTVSHDLRAPLRAINGFSEILVQEYGDTMDVEAQDYLARVIAAAQNMDQLILDLLEFSRLSQQEISKQEVKLTNIAVDIIQAMQSDDPHRKVHTKVNPDLLVYGDYRLLKIVLGNLLSNAWKFTKNNDEAEIHFGCLQNEQGENTYFVKDNGAGFDMTYVDKLFMPFQRLHTADEYEGTGIGLATVQRILAKHKGEIWVESEIGKGTTFYFSFGMPVR